MPDDGEVGDTAEVLGDGNRVVHVENDMPPPPRHKHGLSRTLQNLELRKETWSDGKQ